MRSADSQREPLNALSDRFLNVLFQATNFDFFESVQTTCSTPWTDFASFLPLATAGQVAVPKGPRSALDRSIFVDRAATGLGVEENAIAVGIFDKAFLYTDAPNKFVFK